MTLITKKKELPYELPYSAAEIRALRTRLGLTLEAFAVRLSVDWRTVARWESGESRPRAVYVRLLRELR